MGERLASDLALVADVGGTNTRFALTDIRKSGVVSLLSYRRYATADYPNLDAVLETYFADVGVKPGLGCLALASIVLDDHIRITNCPWEFSVDHIRSQFGLDKLVSINDFAALGWALPELDRQQMVAVNAGLGSLPAHRGDCAVLGPGTGLGVSAVRYLDGHPLVFPSEGGHVGFAPGNPLETSVLQLLETRFGRVSQERLLCGTGLQNLHQALGVLRGHRPPDIDAREITELALSQQDSLCVETIEVFCGLLGSFAGDVALMLGAWDGIYLGGGVVKALADFLPTSQFNDRFTDKGRFADTLASIPCLAITQRDAGLVGSAMALRHSIAVGAERAECLGVRFAS